MAIRESHDSDANTAPYRYTAELANALELKWQDLWEQRSTYASPNPSGPLASPNAELVARPTYYVLDMFPYPSGSGLHVGHPLGYIGTDVFARYKRMTGSNVLHAMGYDAFGLPAERYAVDHGQHPAVTTEQNIANMRMQLRRLGIGHDSRRSIATTDVSFYRWTQWIFLQLYNSWLDPEVGAARPISELIIELDAGRRRLPDHVHLDVPWSQLDAGERADVVNQLRLAYLDEVVVNWCPALGTVLANEEVTADGRSEQGDFPVYRRPLRQWMMRITAYADRLLEDLDLLDWSTSLKTMQANWIGRSVGAEIEFSVDNGRKVPVFTTRPDTLYGVTFLVVAPEHPLLDSALPAAYDATVPAGWRGVSAEAADPSAAIAAYRNHAARMSDREREIGARTMTGVFTGLHAEHPLTGEPLPIFVSDYVLMHYGTGAIMAVPAHDDRDMAFARLMSLPIRATIAPSEEWLQRNDVAPGTPADEWPHAYAGAGTIRGVGSQGDGKSSAEFGSDVIVELGDAGVGSPHVTYKLRDWLFSRQRYWGEPFPIVFGEDGRAHPVPESQLPVVLPELSDFAPREATPDSDPVPPLSRAADWVHTTVDLGRGPERVTRETNTMPQWAGSCWYYLRYLDPENDETLVAPNIERYWLGNTENAGGVDLYVGGVEHAVLHLLYARFWHKVLFDLGHVSTPEPFQRLFNQGYVQAAAYKDARGFYVDAAQVAHIDGVDTYQGEQVTRSYGKMGKSLKNSVAPNDVIAAYGADVLRIYELFLAPLDQDRPWDTQAIVGVSRFVQRLWRLVIDTSSGDIRVVDAPLSPALETVLHRTALDVARDIERLHFNTAISSIMELLNAARAEIGDGAPPRQLAEWLVLMLAPFAPHVCEELWERLGHDTTIVYATFPVGDAAKASVDVREIAVQVNGKLRAVIHAPEGASKEDLQAAARAEPRIGEVLAGREPSRVIVIADRLVNFVVKQ